MLAAHNDRRGQPQERGYGSAKTRALPLAQRGARFSCLAID